MDQKSAFLEKIRQLKIDIEEKKCGSDAESIQNYFAPATLNEEQLRLVQEYLVAKAPAPSITLTEEDQECLEMYEEMVAHTAPLSKADQSLYLDARERNSQAREILAAKYLPAVISIARELKQDGIYIGDLIQEGTVGLTEGLNTVEDTATAHDHILSCIRKSMHMFLLEKEAEKTGDSTILHKVQEMDDALNYLKEELGRKVYIEEIADYLKITEDEVWDILRLTGEDIEEDHDHHEHSHGEHHH